MPSPCSALYDGVATTPKMLVESSCAWIAQDYPNKWLRLVNLCEKAMALGWPRIRRGDLFSIASQQGLEISLCQEFRFDNNLWSVISRYLLMFRPKLAGAIFPKKAAVDDVDLQAMWHDHVRPQTVFFADTWRAARLAFEHGDVNAR